jgi:glycosyltransferase involved in cell wall biosynthesis
MSDQMIFLGNIPKAEEIYYYSQSVGVIFSSIYESFPFQFTKAIAYNCPIYANNIPANISVM